MKATNTQIWKQMLRLVKSGRSFLYVDLESNVNISLAKDPQGFIRVSHAGRPLK